MQQVYERSPDDPEAAIFYALALISTAPATDKTFAQQFNAATILNELAAQMPNHPGIIHYIIHSYDYPPLAQLALPAARSYAKVAPSVPHALHMPSHIFTRLGLWDEAIETDIASATTAKTHVDKTNPGTQSFDWLHSLDYMVYAYLQTAQDGRAKVLVDEVWQRCQGRRRGATSGVRHGSDPCSLRPRKASVERSRVAKIETGRVSLEPLPQCEAITFFARAVGAARSG